MGQSFCKMLEISSKITTCLEVTTFLGVTNSLDVMFLLKVTVFLTEITCSAKSTFAKVAYTRVTKTEGARTSNTCTEGAFIKVDSYIGICIIVASLKDICIGKACTYTSGTYIRA